MALSIGLLAGYIIGPAIAFATALLPPKVAMMRGGGTPSG